MKLAIKFLNNYIQSSMEKNKLCKCDVKPDGNSVKRTNNVDS